MASIAGNWRGLFRKKSTRPPRPDAEGPTYRPLEPLDQRLAAWRAVIVDDRNRAIYDTVAETIDRDAYARLQAKYSEEIESNDELAPTKYLDLAPWFMVHGRIANLLNVDRGPPRSILDIGAGGGQFLAIAKAFGHSVTALDMPKPQIYKDLLALFGIDRIEGGIKLGEPLPEAVGSYDMIVINGQVFDTYRPSGRRWGIAPWASLIEHLCAEHLRYPGTFFLGLNRSAGPKGTEDFLWPLVDLAERHGAVVNRNRATMVFQLDSPIVFDDINHPHWHALEPNKARQQCR